MTDNLLERLFGEPLWLNINDSAVRNGWWLPFFHEQRDTGHRITTSAWYELVQYQQPSHPDYTERDYHEWFYQELVPLVDVAHLGWENRDILGIVQTNYDFDLTNSTTGARLWYVPNDRGGITIQLPEQKPKISR